MTVLIRLTIYTQDRYKLALCSLRCDPFLLHSARLMQQIDCGVLRKSYLDLLLQYINLAAGFGSL